VNKYPDGTLEDDCFFQLGELETQMAHPESGIKEFQNLIDKHPESHLADRALKRIGEIYAFELHRQKDAEKTFETFLERYPKSVFVDDVRKEIRGLRD
jgi:TolA-binding protein